MKKRISDLLDGYEDDSVELSGDTPLSSARIKELTMNRITPKKNKLYRLPARLLAAAAIVAALTASAFAVVHIAGAGELMQGFFAKDGEALSTGQIENLDQVGQTAGTSDAGFPAAVTDNGATITPLAAIADENLCYIRLRVEAPEGTVLPDLDADTQGYYQLNASLTAEEGTYRQFGYYGKNTILTDDDPTDNCKEFVLSFSVPEGDTDLQLNDGVSKILTISGLWIQSLDKEYTPVFTGDFVFDFGISFQSRSIELDAAGLTWHHELLDYTITVESMTLSPLSLSFRGNCDMPRNDWISVGGAGDIEIVMKDGTVFFSQTEDYEVLQRYIQSQPNITLPLTGQPIGVLQNYIPFDQPLDLDQVDYLKYGDHIIPVSVE